MNKNGTPTCPGCKRHCPMGEARCKYGVRYFSEQTGSEPKPETAGQPKNSAETRRRRPRKWEKNLEKGSVAWKLVYFGRKAGKALKRGEVNAAQLLEGMDGAEQARLSETLDRLIDRLKACSGKEKF